MINQTALHFYAEIHLHLTSILSGDNLAESVEVKDTANEAGGLGFDPWASQIARSRQLRRFGELCCALCRC